MFSQHASLVLERHFVAGKRRHARAKFDVQ
jgi:hypothetical protein